MELVARVSTLRRQTVVADRRDRGCRWARRVVGADRGTGRERGLRHHRRGLLPAVLPLVEREPAGADRGAVPLRAGVRVARVRRRPAEVLPAADRGRRTPAVRVQLHALAARAAAGAPPTKLWELAGMAIDPGRRRDVLQLAAAVARVQRRRPARCADAGGVRAVDGDRGGSRYAGAVLGAGGRRRGDRHDGAGQVDVGRGDRPDRDRRADRAGRGRSGKPLPEASFSRWAGWRSRRSSCSCSWSG